MKRKQILLALGKCEHEHTRECLAGISDYALRYASEWDFLTDPFDVFLSLEPGRISPEKADAAFIWAFDHTPLSRLLRQRGIPTINLTLPDVALPFPSVTLDCEAFGRAAARHLDQPPITRHLYVGPDFGRSQLQLKGFRAGLLEAGRPGPETLIEPMDIGENSALKRFKHLRDTLQDLSQITEGRIGVYTFSDSFGHAVIRVALDMGLAIPNRIAVLGSGNESLVCNLSRIPISSLPISSRKIGFEAARMLHAMMRGEKVAPSFLVGPEPVVERLSSSHLAVEDPLVSKALAIIQDQATRGLRVKEILEFLPIRRRAFELRFRAAIGRSPHEEIDRIRIEKAISMLRDDQETNARIAIACGFSSPENLEQSVREKTRHTPKYFRKRQTP